MLTTACPTRLRSGRLSAGRQCHSSAVILRKRKRSLSGPLDQREQRTQFGFGKHEVFEAWPAAYGVRLR